MEHLADLIKNALPDAEVYVLDPYQDGQHLQSFVISSSFSDKSLIEQHRIVMNALQEELADKVHAMGLKTFTPEKWTKERHKYTFLQ